MNTKVAIFIAIILAIFSAIAVRMYIKDIEKQNLDRLRPVEVLIAATNVEAGKVATSQDIKMISIPRELYDSNNMYQSSDSTALIGKLQFNRSIKNGTIILRGYLGVVGVNPNDSLSGLSGVKASMSLAPNERAVTLKVDALSGVAMLLRPKEYVDIFWTGELTKPMAQKLGIPFSSDKRSETVTLVLLSDVQLMALDNRETNMPGVTRGKVVAPKESYSSVTVVCKSWEEAKMLIFAQTSGKITLVKKGSDHIVVEDDQGVTSENFLDLARKVNLIRKSR